MLPPGGTYKYLQMIYQVDKSIDIWSQNVCFFDNNLMHRVRFKSELWDLLVLTIVPFCTTYKWYTSMVEVTLI